MRRFLLIAAIAWLIGGWLFARIPPRGHLLARAEHKQAVLRVEAFTAEGQLVVSRHGKINGGRRETRGPLTVHDPENGQVLVSALSDADKLIEVHWTGRLAVARQGAMTRLVSLQSGQTLVEHPHRKDGRYRTGGLSPSGKRFFVDAGDSVVIWDEPFKKPLKTFQGLQSPMFGDDRTFFAMRPVTPPDSPGARVQMESVRVEIDRDLIAADERRPTYDDCGGGLKSPSGEFGVGFFRGQQDEGFGVYHNGRMERIWSLITPPELGTNGIFHPPLSFTRDSSEIHMTYLAGKHAVGVVRWRTSDGERLTPMPAKAGRLEAGRLEGSMTTSPDTRWAVKHKVTSEPLPKWVPPSARKWLFSTIPGLMNALVPMNRIEIVDNRRDRVAAVIPTAPSISMKITPDSRSLVVGNRPELVRYALPANGQTSWLVWGVVPAACIGGLALRRRRMPRADLNRT